MSWLSNTLLGGITFEPVRKGLKSVTGMTDAQLGGAGLIGAALPMLGPVFGSTAPAANGATGAATGGGLLGKVGSVMGPISQGLQISNQVAAMNQQQPTQSAPMQQRPGPDLSQFIAAESQRNQMMDAERQKRLQQQQMALGGLFGGANGRIA